MISNLKRQTLFAAAIVCPLLFLTGCKSPEPVQSKVEPAFPTIPTPPPPPAPPATNQWPLAIFHPRPPGDAADNMAPDILTWDAVEKEYPAKAGETNAPFTFKLTNVSSERVMIYDTSTTCECTVAQLPSKPWTIPPGGNGQLQANLDVRGRTGAVTNYIIVFTSKGNRLLTVKAVLPTP